MNYNYEDLARAHSEARRHEARLLRRGRQLERVQRSRRKADRANARLLLERPH